MGDENSIVDELKEAFKDLGIPETSAVDNKTTPTAKSKPKSTPGSVNPASSFDPKKINEVIFLEKQVVEPERLNAIQASISKWANGIPHHDLTDLGNKIKLTSVYERPAYLVTLHTQHETRELKNGEYPGDEIPPLKVIKKSVDVWSMNVPLFEDFVDEKINYIIEGSNEVFECGGCDGHGEVVCDPCNGLKFVTCGRCHGDGKIRCTSCNGEGRKKCGVCEGKRYIGFGNNKTRCPSCSDGYKSCKSCIQGYNTCNKCNGNGQVRCPRCDGRGKLTCARCKGKRRICQFIYLDNVFKPIVANALISHPEVPFRLYEGEILLGEEKESLASSIMPDCAMEIVQNKFQEDIFAPLLYEHAKLATSELITAAIKNTDSSERIIKQKFTVYRINAITVGYSYSNKQYSLVLYGNDYEKIYTKTSPIHEIGDTYFASAQKLFKGRAYSQALEVIEKALSISPNRIEAKEQKKKILDRINAEYVLGGLSGGLITALLFRLSWAHNSLPFWGNTWWDSIKVSSFLFVGVLIGLMTAAIFADKGSTRIKENRKRVFYPFIVSVLSTIVFVLLWNLAADKVALFEESRKLIVYSFAISFLTTATLIIASSFIVRGKYLSRFKDRLPIFGLIFGGFFGASIYYLNIPDYEYSWVIFVGSSIIIFSCWFISEEGIGGILSGIWVGLIISGIALFLFKKFFPTSFYFILVWASLYGAYTSIFSKVIRNALEQRKRLIPLGIGTGLIVLNLVIIGESVEIFKPTKEVADKSVQKGKERLKSAKNSNPEKGHTEITESASVDDWFKKGNSLVDSGNYKEAITAYNKVIEVDPNHAKAYYNRGLAYGNLGNYDEAIGNYKKAIEIAPDNANFYINLGAAYIELKNYQEALNNFDTAIKLDPNDAEGFVNRGIAYGKLGYEQQQIDDYKTAAQMGNMWAQAALKKANIEW